MELLEKREHRTIPNKPGVFHLNSVEQRGDSKLVVFKNLRHNDKKVIVIKSPLLEKDNYKVIHVGARISLIISEKKKLEKPLYMHNLDLKQSDFTYYERLKSFDYTIPEDYYVHVETKWNDFNKTVEVYFK